MKHQPDENKKKWKERMDKISYGLAEGWSVRENNANSEIVGLIHYDPHSDYWDIMVVTILTEGDKYRDAIQWGLKQTATKIFKARTGINFINCKVAKQDDWMRRMVKKVGFKRSKKKWYTLDVDDIRVSK